MGIRQSVAVALCVRRLTISFLCLLFVPVSLFAANSAPAIGAIIPQRGSSVANQLTYFVTTFSDANGWQNIQYVYSIVNNSTSCKNCFYGYYNQNTNKLYLRNDANTAWLGGYVPGAAKVIENSYAKLDCSKTTISGSGNNLSVKWAVTFKSTFTGAKKCYLYVKDDANAYQGWLQKGTWTINLPDTISPTGSIKINNDAQYSNLNTVTLNLSATDNVGGSGLSQMQFSNNNSTWSTAEGYATTKSWTLASGDGQKTVYVKFKDIAGNWSQSYSATIILDTTPPVIVITFPGNGAFVDEAQIRLEGTVDGIAFSENVTLPQEGENIITKTAQDSAGNSATAAIKVNLYSGELIGAEGGAVVSPDGKVKLTIPSGALASPTRIRIKNVNNSVLANTAPQNEPLISAVECTPYGLVFDKPATMTYTLNQAEVPGTTVELGYYDPTQNKTIPTGQVSSVGTDSYTINFLIQHFSTYAALKNLVSSGAPIGIGVQIPLPDMFTGSFSHAIPITVSPGRKGMQPSLSLAYRSSNPNSWVGMGFSLNPGYIVRSTRLGPPSYNDTQDTFYFITDAGSTELVHLTDNLYQAKIESSFAKFFKETDDSWKVAGKDGSVLRFGQSSSAKETSPSGTFAWYLTKAIDANKNYIEYTYIKDEGKSYLSRIDYTGNEAGFSPTNSVEFFLESREDTPSSYISNARIAIAKRLHEIQVKVNSELVWRYVLEYEYSQDTNRSLLKSVKQYGADGKVLPEQKLSYQKAR